MKADYDPLENLKLLSPHAQQTQLASLAFARLTPYDIAAKLAYAKLGRGPTLLARIKIADQKGLYPELRQWLKVEVYQDIVKRPLEIHERMIDTCLEEVIDAKICPECKGRGKIPEVTEGQPTGRYLPCLGSDRARGKVKYHVECREGFSPWTDSIRAKRLGIHHEVFKRNFQRVYIEILTIPWTWESQVRQAVA